MRAVNLFSSLRTEVEVSGSLNLKGLVTLSLRLQVSLSLSKGGFIFFRLISPGCSRI